MTNIKYSLSCCINNYKIWAVCRRIDGHFLMQKIVDYVMEIGI
nr:MAG TPA_asm: hypothetical protein [Caudoviricetes sp.]